jgi:hypothetical protein
MSTLENGEAVMTEEMSSTDVLGWTEDAVRDVEDQKIENLPKKAR